MTNQETLRILKRNKETAFLCKAEIGRLLNLKDYALDNFLDGLDFYRFDNKRKFYAVTDISKKLRFAKETGTL